MPSKPRTRVKRTKPDLIVSGGVITGDESAYAQLRMLVGENQGRFALIFIRSAVSNARREEILGRLSADLGGRDFVRVRLDRERWDAVNLSVAAIEQDPTLRPLGLVILGLEETPGMFEAPSGVGRPRRPIALAILNHGREALHRRCHLPVIVWCDNSTFALLQSHAPDLIDHFAGIISFESVERIPEQLAVRGGVRIDDVSPNPNSSNEVTSSGSAIEFYKRRLARFPLPSPARARALMGLSQAMSAGGEVFRHDGLDQAVALAREAIDLLSPEMDAVEWARGQINLALIYNNGLAGDRDENLRRAIACYEAALRVYAEAAFPSEWAMTQNNLGSAYRSLPTGDRGDNLRRAIASYSAASRVYTEAAVPSEWAATQNNLGVAYCELPTGDRGDNLRQAIACYEAALRVRTEAAFPSDWAEILNNLGNAYSELPAGDRGENLRQAIACYTAAFRVYTEAAFQSEWATTQNNLGGVYFELPTGNPSENLRQAIACCDAALRVRTKAEFPREHFRTIENRIVAIALLADSESREV